MKNNSFEVVDGGSNLVGISSTEQPRGAREPYKGKLLITVDNLKCSAYNILEPTKEMEELEGHPFYEVLEYWKVDSNQPLSKMDEKVLEQLENDLTLAKGPGEPMIMEFPIGRHKVEQVSNKRKPKGG